MAGRHTRTQPALRRPFRAPSTAFDSGTSKKRRRKCRKCRKPQNANKSKGYRRSERAGGNWRKLAETPRMTGAASRRPDAPSTRGKQGLDGRRADREEHNNMAIALAPRVYGLDA